MLFEDLHSANFKPLDDTVSDWTTMLTKLQQLAADAKDGLVGKANKANWAGYNAAVSRQFIVKTAGEFSDAHTQATSILNILRDSRDELKTQQRLLREAIERGRAKQLTVTISGTSFAVDRNPDAKEVTQKDIDGLRDELQGILDKATEIDNSAATTLQALVDLTDYGFSEAKYKDRDAAAAALKEAEELAKLAKKKPEDLTPSDFDRLNAGLQKRSGDPLFAERFAEQMGPKGTLEFWAGLNDLSRSYNLYHNRPEQYDDLQKNLSLTLATASHADTPEMSKWKYDMADLGGQPLNKHSSAYGFQVMSNLMRWGDFDDGFLQDYGAKLMQTEKTLSENGRQPAWQNTLGLPQLNRTGTDTGSDPLVGFLKALSNSPGAGPDFFNQRFLSKDDDHEFTHDTDGDGNKGRKELSNFQYLFEERHWPPEMDSKGEDSIEGRNNLALALEAAATGHRAGEMPTADTPAHNAAQARLVEDIFASVSEVPERVTKYGYMSDSLGQIAAEYLPDINRATTDADDKNESIGKLFPITGAVADLDHSAVTRFLVTVGQNPEGYAAIEVGQKAYMANLMDYHLNPDLPADQRYEQSTENTIREISRRSAEVGGTLAIGRQEAVLGEAKEADSDFELAVNQRKSALSGIISTGIGIGTAFVASPVVGVAVGGAASTVSGVILEQVFKDSEPENLKNSGAAVGDLWEDSKERNNRLSAEAARLAAAAHKTPDMASAGEWTRYGTADGFNDASTSVRRMADDLETEIPT
ncbi:hypothetical protein AB0A69_31415 [Streptomyces sp. NPDC045431]|uniref:hypothetical protein n=1 Tax=Streptomyces sp. NPDC045431 TaxID=3155613 RepID=UPI0033D69E99